MKEDIDALSESRWLILLVAAISFIPFLGWTHLFDWDEINFAESSREMLLTGDFFRVTINFEPFWEKPPLFFWLQTLSMKLFGINEFAARLPNALAGLVTLILLTRLGERLHDRRMGIIWALTYLCSILPNLYFRSGIIDPVFNLFIFISVWHAYQAMEEGQGRSFLYAGLFSGLAVLTKGPVGLLLLLLTVGVMIVRSRFRSLPGFRNILLFLVPFAITTFAWYGPETINNGPWFLVRFIKYQIGLFLTPVAGHEQPLPYHFYVVFLGCFPLSVFGLAGLLRSTYLLPTTYAIWMKSLFWVVMILFTIVKTKIVHYSSMSYLPLSYLAASYLYTLHRSRDVMARWMKRTFLITGCLVGLILLLFPLVGVFRLQVAELVRDAYAADALRRNVDWSGWEGLAGILFLPALFVFLRNYRASIVRGLWILTLSTGLTLTAYSVFVVPKIEAHSQGASIEFFKSLAGQDVYLVSVGFKTYGLYFYGRVTPETAWKRHDSKRLLKGEIDKPVYVISKKKKGDLSLRYPELIPLGSDGGFSFYRRDVPVPL